MTRMLATLALCLAAAPLVVGAAPSDDLDPVVYAALTRFLRFSTAELSDLQRDRTVKHNLDPRSPGEFGVAGAARIRAPKSVFFAAARDIVHFKSGPGVLQIGRFSDPPSIDDLAALTVNKDDFDAATCRLHDCGIRLPAETIRRVQQEIDVNAPNAQEKAAAWFKHALLADLAAYIGGEPGRFEQYDDGDAPIRPLDDFAELLAHMPSIGALAPGLPIHLVRGPGGRLPDAEDFFYWSKEKFGVAPFITVTHVTIVCPSAATCLMATKDVYSSRYLDASVALGIATDAGTPDAFDLV